jgi:phosphatidate phosphatase APP1
MALRSVSTSKIVRKALHLTLHGLEAAIDGIKDVSGSEGPAVFARIVPYRSYGTAASLVIRGRLVRNRPIRPSETDAAWRNAMNMVQRWSSREVPGVRVRARARGVELTGASDAEGYFKIRVDLPPGGPAPDGWVEVALDLPDVPSSPPEVAKVLVPSAAAQFGVISDIDDTIVFSSATNYLRMAKIVLLGNAFSRLPFKGVAAFYRGLEKGTAGSPVNPFFYVSSSPWNLYDVLRDLFEHRSIPAGPLLLQDFGIDREKLFHEDHRSHKLRMITDVLRTYQDLQFLLIGDSGQADPEIYTEVVRTFPGRIKAVYIRDVSGEHSRDAAVQALAQQVKGEHNCDLLLVEDTVAAARHALEHGWIDPSVIQEIGEEKAAEPPKAAVEEVLGQE